MARRRLNKRRYSDPEGVDAEVSLDNLFAEEMPASFIRGIDITEEHVKRRIENTASILALGMLAVVAITVLMALLAPLVVDDLARAKMVQETSAQLLPGITALMGAAIGYYFGKP